MESHARSQKRNDSPRPPLEHDPENAPKSTIDEGEPAKKNKTAAVIRDDVEFDREDYDGRIQRCEERIRNGFCKVTFEKKIERLKAAKEARA